MPSPTMTLIASSTVPSGGAASIDFNSIPSTYTDLLLKISARSSITNTGGDFRMRINGDTGNNYAMRSINGYGTSTASANETGATGSVWLSQTDGTIATTSTFNNTEVYISNYTSSNAKSISIDNVFENNGTTAGNFLVAGYWSGTSAITSLSIFPASSYTPTGNFLQFSTAYLYGIKNS